jgi:hypothetical protein
MKIEELFEIKQSDIESIDFTSAEDFEEQATDLGYTVSTEGQPSEWQILIAKKDKKIVGAYNKGTNNGILLKKTSKGVDEYEQIWEIE